MGEGREGQLSSERSSSDTGICHELVPRMLVGGNIPLRLSYKGLPQGGGGERKAGRNVGKVRKPRTCNNGGRNGLRIKGKIRRVHGQPIQLDALSSRVDNI